MTFCTLFDHNYLDKGLTLYSSLEKVCENFKLYVLCMSDKCLEILADLNKDNVIPISLKQFEDCELLRVKKSRSVGEYCWTCTSSLILYVLKTFRPEYCTYIDADMYFYSDPEVIISEMKCKNASVQIIGHRFPAKVASQREFEVGKYCVEFDTFKNDENGIYLLNVWRKQCLEYCSADNDGVHYGDQKYQDNWCNDYDFCIETSEYGAGVGPWNYSEYKLENSYDGQIVVNYKGNRCKLIFYHFEDIEYVDRKHVVLNNLYNSWGMSPALANALYPNYLKEIECYKTLLSTEYNIEVLIKKHPAYYKAKKISFLKIWKVVRCHLLRSLKVRLLDIYYRKYKHVYI